VAESGNWKDLWRGGCGERLLGVYFRYWVFGVGSRGEMYCRLEEKIEAIDH
jgi:muconolactone delta-isomerase